MKESIHYLGPVRTTTKNRAWCLQKKIENVVITYFWFLQPCSHVRDVKFFV